MMEMMAEVRNALGSDAVVIWNGQIHVSEEAYYMMLAMPYKLADSDIESYMSPDPVYWEVVIQGKEGKI